ncbi:MAG: hypothetical protein US88_C0017G0005 [Parcubacteria group bacterium GW2011_GWA2_38_27]|nr:MAG: hypothetical protein US88_C0017G0005 [Parcubacteria group bacterium GW2011_GWA2_38_27]
MRGRLGRRGLGGGMPSRPSEIKQRPAPGAASLVSFVQNRFGLCHIIAPRLNFPIFARPIRPREARKGMETSARRAQRGSPSAGSKSLAILSICFAQ